MSCDLVVVLRMPTLLDECPSAPHTLVQLVLRVGQQKRHMVVQRTPKKFPGESGGKPRTKIDFRKKKEEKRVVVVFWTMPSLEMEENS